MPDCPTCIALLTNTKVETSTGTVTCPVCKKILTKPKTSLPPSARIFKIPYHRRPKK